MSSKFTYYIGHVLILTWVNDLSFSCCLYFQIVLLASLLIQIKMQISLALSEFSHEIETSITLCL